MSILWCGGEDIDFQNGNTPTVDTNSTRFRSGYARCTLTPGVTTNLLKSSTFGAVTSAWLSCRLYCNVSAGNFRIIGLGKSGTNSGLFIGNQSASNQRTTLYKWDAGTLTQLAAESGNSLPTTGTLIRVDLQIANYGTSATVNVFVNNTLVISYSGSVALSGVSDLDQVWLCGNLSLSAYLSEVVLADFDTRSLSGLATLALTGAGTTDAWTGPTYTNINGTSFSDANPTNSNTPGQDDQYNVTDLPSGTFSVKAVKTSIRAAVSSSPSATQIKMGYNGGGTLGFGTGSTKTPGTAYSTLEQLDETNPVTSAAWAQSDINSLQLEFQSA